MLTGVRVLLGISRKAQLLHRLGLRIPRIDFGNLLVRLLDSLLGLPALDQHSLYHAADDVGGEHLT